MRLSLFCPSFALLCLLTSGVASAAPGDMENEIKDMDWLGFQQFQEVSRVFVRTTEPVRYKIDNSKADRIIVTLENTRIPLRNNRRNLDTHYFDSPVTFVRPKAIEGPSPRVQIEILLRNKVPFKETRNDNILALDFERQ